MFDGLVDGLERFDIGEEEKINNGLRIIHQSNPIDEFCRMQTQT
jgi:hypothetical protein